MAYRKGRFIPARLIVYLVIFLIIRLSSPLCSQEMEAPVEVQFPLFKKILTFDRNLKERVGEEIVLAIVYQEKFRRSLNVKDRIENHLGESPHDRVEGIPLRYVSINLANLAGFRTALEREEVDVIYLCPLRAVDIRAIVSISRSLGITSLTGVQAYCELGIAVGIGSKGGSPEIIINLAGAAAEGADFSSRLLKLAKVIGNE